MLYRVMMGWLFVAALLLLGGCAQNTMLRSELEQVCTFVQEGDCATSALQHYAQGQPEEYYLGFVEFDDQGQLRQRQQLQAVVDKYNRIAGQNDVIIAAFVHGWHHSAEPGDDNIQQFRKLLRSLSRTESAGSKTTGATPRTVLGVYVGWRGDSITIPYVNGITFWERKNTAQEVGGQGVPELFVKLEEIVKVRAGIGVADAAADTTDAEHRQSRLVLIGHSFGGAVTFTALQQILADRYYNAQWGKTFQADAQGFGDLVVLVNPAFEALRFATLYDIGQQGCRNYSVLGQLPKMAILTSESDYATKLAFPVGRILSTLFEAHTKLERDYCTAQGKQQREVAEGTADRHTVGHFEPFLTHRLDPVQQKRMREVDFDFRQLRNEWRDQQYGNTLYFEQAQLHHLGNTHPLNPYLNIQVDRKLIRNHNDIWGDEVVGFLRDLIVVTTLPNSGQ
jgi:hypothetical protein